MKHRHIAAASKNRNKNNKPPERTPDLHHLHLLRKSTTTQDSGDGSTTEAATSPAKNEPEKRVEIGYP